MAKKKYATEGQLKSLFVVMFILFFGSVIFYGTNSYRVDLLQREIDSMPHYECWNETVRETIEVPSHNYNETDLWAYWGTCGNEVYISTERIESSKILCDKEIGIYKYSQKLVNHGNETKLCFIEEVKEVCQLNRHDAILGADE